MENTMETSVVGPTRDDITFDTEETDNISEISTTIPPKDNIGNNTEKHREAPRNHSKEPSKSKQLARLGNSSSRGAQSGMNPKKLWGVIVLLTVVVGILAAMLLVDDSDSSSEHSAPALPHSPTPSPSALSTVTLRGKLEHLLADYTPLDEQTMTWLTEESSWTPETDEAFAKVYNNETADYLWIERYAMGLLYFSADGPNWARNDDWMSKDKPVCKWYSMEYNKCPGPAKNLVLYLNKMKGSLPSVIFELTALEKIHLARNDLTGTLPDSISNMQNLKFIDLASNWLNGTIPDTIQNMTNLEKLYLSNNDLTGSIPEDIGNAHINLVVLSWWGNYLSGTIPASIGNMTLLTDLSLSENVLSGSIPPSIGDLTVLSRLSLHTNHLSGTIPETIIHMSNLQWLSLYENQFQGSFPQLPITMRKCFLGSCFYDITNAIESRCLFFDSCE